LRDGLNEVRSKGLNKPFIQLIIVFDVPLSRKPGSRLLFVFLAEVIAGLTYKIQGFGSQYAVHKSFTAW